MPNVNETQNRDSSDGDTTDVDSGVVKEKHNNSSCEFKKFKAKSSGKTVYVWKRLCKCGQYSDSNETHTSDQCKWKKGKDNVWKRRCVCGAPKISSYTGNPSGEGSCNLM